jgi:hypothetical protein
VLLFSIRRPPCSISSCYPLVLASYHHGPSILLENPRWSAETRYPSMVFVAFNLHRHLIWVIELNLAPCCVSPLAKPNLDCRQVILPRRCATITRLILHHWHDHPCVKREERERSLQRRATFPLRYHNIVVYMTPLLPFWHLPTNI